MSRVEEIERAIQELSQEEFARGYTNLRYLLPKARRMAVTSKQKPLAVPAFIVQNDLAWH